MEELLLLSLTLSDSTTHIRGWWEQIFLWHTLSLSLSLYVYGLQYVHHSRQLLLMKWNVKTLINFWSLLCAVHKLRLIVVRNKNIERLITGWLLLQRLIELKLNHRKHKEMSHVIVLFRRKSFITLVPLRLKIGTAGQPTVISEHL